MASSNCESLLSFQLSGKFADFEIRVSDYIFKTHKVILASKSHYFGILCGSDFQESSQGYAELSDDDPAIVARTLEFIYTGNYSSSGNDGNVPRLLTNALRPQAPPTPPSSFHLGVAVDVPGWKVHINVYSLADKYDMIDLKQLAQQKFLEDFRKPFLDILELIEIAAFIYSVPPVDESGLRKYVVHRTQLAMPEITSYPTFERLLKSDPDFAFDFATKYGARQFVYCSYCEAWISVIANCSCGFSGICDKNDFCTAQAWESMQCSACKKVGYVTRDQQKAASKMDCVEIQRGKAGAPLTKYPKLAPKK